MSKVVGIEVDYIKINNKGYLSFDSTTNEITISHINTLPNFVGGIKNIITTPPYYEVFNIHTSYNFQVEFDFLPSSSSTLNAYGPLASITGLTINNNIMSFNLTTGIASEDNSVRFNLYSNDNSNFGYTSFDFITHDTSKPIGTHAAHFTYATSYLAVSPISMPGLTDLTASFWIKCTVATSFTDQAFINSSSTSNFGSVVVYNGDLKLWGSVNSSASMDNAGLNNQAWHHVAVIKTGTLTKYYFDFVQSIGYTGADVASYDVNIVQICRFYGTYGFTGDVANLQYFPYAVDIDDLRRYAYRHIDNTKGENCKASFTFNNTFNSSVNGYTGTQTGGVTFVTI